MKVYALTLMAWCIVNDEYLLRIKPGIMLALSDDDAKERGLSAAAEALPIADGFTDHQVVFVELPSHIDLEGYQLEWRVTP